jgi:SAM-dependent methyltransferase
MDEGRSGDDAAGLALALVGYNKEVLGVGCASASLSERLAGQACTVFWAGLDDGEWQRAKDESFDMVLLTDALAASADPHSVLRAAARKLKPSGMLVAWLPNVEHGDTRIAIEEGRFHYGGPGLLEGPQLGHFTLEAIRDQFGQAGLVIVDTARVIRPLIEPQFGVTRDETRPEGLHDLMDDPEVETYEFVLRAVRDNGDQALADLARRVHELSDRARDESTRAALLRAELLQKDLIARNLELYRKLAADQKLAIEEQRRYIEALRGHISGLERNVEALTVSLEEIRRSSAATDAKYQAMLGQWSVRATAPIRSISRRLSRKRKNL